MRRKDGRIEPGQSLRGAISARAWNRAQDAADVVLGGRPGLMANGPADVLGPFYRVKLYWRSKDNDDTKVLKRYHYARLETVGTTAGINGLINPPEQDGDESWSEIPVFTNTNSFQYYADNLTRIAIALEPIRNNSIGWAAIGGICPAKVDNVKGTWKYAIPYWEHYTSPVFSDQTRGPDLETAETAGEWRMQTSFFAGFPIVWHYAPTDTQNQWALVDLSGWWSAPLVLAKPASSDGLVFRADGDPVSGGVTGRVRLYEDYGRPTDYYVPVKNEFSTIDGDEYVWLLNPFSSVTIGTSGLNSLREWQVFASDHKLRARGTNGQVDGAVYLPKQP